MYKTSFLEFIVHNPHHPETIAVFQDVQNTKAPI